MKRALRIGGLSLASALVLLMLFVLWVLHTESGAQTTLAVARHWLPAGLTIGDVGGTVGGTLRVQRFRYRDESVGLDLRIDSAQIEAAPLALLTRRLSVARVNVDGVRVDLFPATVKHASAPGARDPWMAPLDMSVAELQLTRGELRRPGAEPLSIGRAQLRGASWIRDQIIAERLEVASPDGAAQLALRIGSRAPKLELLRGTFNWRGAEHEWAGSLEARSGRGQLQLEAALRAPIQVTAAGTLAVIRRGDALESWRAHLAVSRFDPHPLLDTDVFRTAALQLDGSGHLDDASLQGVLSLDEQRVIIERLAVSWREALLQVSALRLRLNDQPAALTGNATLALDGSAPASARLSWEEFQLPEAWMGTHFRCSGKVAATVAAQRFAMNGEVRLARAERNATLKLRVDGSRDSLHVQELELTQRSGALSVAGTVELSKPVRWQLDAAAREFDPGLFVEAWPGALNFQLHTRGEWPDAGPQARFQLQQLQGRLRQRAVSGSGDISIGADRRPAGRLELLSGGAALSATASTGAHPRLDATLRIAALQEWHPQLAGALDLRLSVAGRWPDVDVQAHASASHLRRGDSRIATARARLSGRNARAPRGTLELEATGLALAGLEFADLDAKVDGDAGAHRFALAANGKTLSLGLHASGALQHRNWSGTLDHLGITVARAPPLALAAPSRLVIAQRDFELGSTCLAGGDITLCVGARRVRGALSANYTVRALPLGVLAAIAAPGNSISLEGLLEGHGELQRNLDGVLSGRAVLTSTSGALVQGPGKDALRLEYRDFGIDLDLTPDAARARLRGLLEKQGELTGSFSMAVHEPDPALAGEASIGLRDLAPLGWWAPQLANLRGSGELAARLSGTLAQPRVAFSVRASGLDAEVPVLGVHLREGNLSAQLEPGGEFTAEGSLASGDGTVHLSGSRNADRRLQLKIAGNNFLAANIPGARVVIAPDLALGGKLGDFALTGAVTIEDADVNLEKLSINRTYRASSDVVVVDREQAIRRRASGLTTDVRVLLGQKVKVVGFGLDATVGGEVRVVEGQQDSGRGTGEIRLAGTYEAFGRKLGIERGKLLFAGTPLDDPQLDILATRKLQDVTAKLAITGTAQHPKLDVFTDPAMSQADAMSYLLTGKPASDAHGEDGAVVQSATQNAGILLGNRLAKKLGGKVGFIDQVGVEQNADLGGSAFTVGKYLSPKLFVSYGVGLFEPGSAVTVRYEFSERWSLEANDTPEDQHVGVRYRIEK